MVPTQSASRRGGVALSLLKNPAAVFGTLWAVVAFVGVWWAWGEDPKVFPSPDESVNRLAASLIVHHGRPFIHLPYADPENIVHPRFWVTLGDHAVPAYAPVGLYVYAALIAIPGLSAILIAAAPATAVGAFVAGTARLLPEGRRWLALLAPPLGFPALYWILRPWVNISLLLVCLCWTLFWFASWRATGKEASLRWMMGSVGLAAAIRPDAAGYVLGAALCVALAVSPSEWKRIFTLVFVSGALAVLVNLLLNYVITGAPFKAAYQILVEQEPDDDDSTTVPGPIGTLLLPMGIPTLQHALKFMTKYWIDMGALRVVLLSQVALVPLFFRKTWAQRAFVFAAILVFVCFLVSRMSIDVYGARSSKALVHQSIPRYWTPVYLFAGLPLLLFLGNRRKGLVLFVGTVVACLTFARGVLDVATRQPASIHYLHRFQADNTRWLEAVGRQVRDEALVFSKTRDKLLWSRWRLGTLHDMTHVAASMDRALAAHIPVYMVEPKFSVADYRNLGRELKKRNISLTKLDSGRGVYRVKFAPPPVSALSVNTPN